MNTDSKTVAIIPAAGAGIRMGRERPKQFLDFNGMPLLAVTLAKFQNCPVIDGIIVVAPPDQVDTCQTEIISPYRLSKVEKVVAGGARRQDSVRKGIEATEGRYGLVLIHDGVRPLVATGLIERVVEAGRNVPAVITALPAKETVKEIDTDRLVIKTYDRRRVWMVQTPQVFRYHDILMAHRRAHQEGWEEMTDDALLVERMGIPVRVVEGSEDNIKVTTPHDLELACFLSAKSRGESS